jgi:hypothetical protein
MRTRSGWLTGINKTSEMASDMITLGAGGDAIFPLASETEIVGALPAYVIMT